MKLVLPYPPSSNRYWRVWRGRAVKSAEAREYQKKVKFQTCFSRGESLGIPYMLNTDPLSGPVCVSVALYRPRKSGDLDNSLKVLLDSLKGIAFEDDSQVVELHAVRFEDKANPRAVVTIEAVK